MNILKLSMVLTLIFLPFVLLAQLPTRIFVIQGTVFSKNSNSVLSGVEISLMRTNSEKDTFTTTDGNGKFELSFKRNRTDSISLKVHLKLNGYQEQNVTYTVEDDNEKKTIYLISENSILTLGTPGEEVTAEDMQNTGKATLDKALHYLIPTFNSTNQPISDGTAHYDPADLRNLGTSRTLITIHKKRKNPSAFVYVNDTPNKGEVAVDLKSIPMAMLQKVTIRKDGGSAEYGSDAIAGVIDFELKGFESCTKTNVNLNTGITGRGEGVMWNYNLFKGLKIGEYGFLNVSHSLYNQEKVYKTGEPQVVKDYGYNDSINNVWSSWIKAHPSLGVQFGQPTLKMMNVFFNTKIPISETKNFYSFGGATYRQNTSFALYRTPYAVTDSYHLVDKTRNGFQPTFESEVLDHQLTLGLNNTAIESSPATTAADKWLYDLSYSMGHNGVNYTVQESFNPSLKTKSPTVFRPGGYEFNTTVVDLLLKRELEDNSALAKVWIEKLDLVLGSEFRMENYIAKEGDEASYEGVGAISFPGIRPSDKIDVSRYNLGGYANTNLTFKNPRWTAGGTFRIENYTDFGNNLSGQFNTQYKINNLLFRAAFSRCFRAPALHQRYFSAVITKQNNNPKQGIFVNEATLNNENPIIKALGIPSLKAETSWNFTSGMDWRSEKPNILVNIDYFDIQLKDRIVYSKSISRKGNPIIEQNFEGESLKFFANALDTRTRGIDASVKFISDNHQWKCSIAYTYAWQQIDSIKTPTSLSQAGIQIVDRKETTRLLFSRPNEKLILRVCYEPTSFWQVVLSATRFGLVKYNAAQAADNEDQVFRAKCVIDLYGSYKMKSSYNLFFNINNIFDEFPDAVQVKDPLTHSTINLGGRFKYTHEVNQFDYNGINFNLGINMNF
jgi:iron complex outermembrane recepter protein